MAFVADGNASAGVRGYVGSGALDPSRRRQVCRMLEALGAWSYLRGLLYSRERVSPDRTVDFSLPEYGPLGLFVRVVGLHGGGGRGVVLGGRGGEVARGCLRGGRVSEVRRHKVPHLVSGTGREAV